MKNLKKLLTILLCFIICLSCVGCGDLFSQYQGDSNESITDDGESEQYSDITEMTVAEESESVTESDTESENVYLLSALPGSLEIPDKYNVYSLDNPFTEEMCKSQGVEYDNMNSYLELSGDDMLMYFTDDLISNPNCKITVKVKSEKDYGVNNLKYLSDEDFKLWADVMALEFDVVNEYNVVKTDYAKYIVFDWKDYNQRRYATIVNGKMVYIIGESTNKDVLASIDEDLKSIAGSLRLDVE